MDAVFSWGSKYYPFKIFLFSEKKEIALKTGNIRLPTIPGTLG